MTQVRGLQGFLISACMLSLVFGSCDLLSCQPAYTPSPVTKLSATTTIRLGLLVDQSNVAGEVVSMARLAVDSVNNDSSILPFAQLELYTYIVNNTEEVIYSSMNLKNTVGGYGLISYNSEDNTQTSQELMSAFKISQISVTSTTIYYAPKIPLAPTLSRLYPADSLMIDAMVHLIGKQFLYQSCVALVQNTPLYQYAGNAFISKALPAGVIIPIAVALNPNPSYIDLIIFVTVVKMHIQEYKMRAFLMFMEPELGWIAAQALEDAGVFGKQALYIFPPIMATSYLMGEAPPLALLDGAIGLFPDLTPATNAPLDNWNNANPSTYPGNRPQSNVTFYTYDAVYTFAHAFDKVHQSGGNSSNCTAVLDAISKTNFDGGSGRVSFNANRDNAIQSVLLLNFRKHNQTLPSAIYNNIYGNITYITPFYYFNGSVNPPDDSWCSCRNGTCDSQGSCTCFPGFYGRYCELFQVNNTNNVTVQTASPFDTKQLVAWLVPVVVVIVASFVIGLLYIRRRKERIVKDIALRQRSEISREDIKLLNRIGRGASGEVFKAMFRGTEVAVKSLLAGSASSNVVQEFMLETAIMCGLRHPNIVLFMGSCFDREKKEMLLVMEYMQKGSLHDILHNPKLSLPFELQLHMATQAAQGMNFLHESNPPILHCDLKSHNILLDEKWNARISDFGITKFKDAKKNSAEKQENVGTIFWTSPEVLEGQPHSEASDCYSFGIVLWEIFHRSDPYPGKDAVAVAVDVIRKAIRPSLNPKLPREIEDLILDCWAQDPTKRPAFSNVMNRLRTMSLEHPVYNFSSQDSRTEAPSGDIFLVHASVSEIYQLFEIAPRATKDAVLMYIQMLQSALPSYGGYEVSYDEKTFAASFKNAIWATNWCIACQVSLLHLDWPQEILDLPNTKEKRVDGVLVSRGLNVRMSIYAGNANCEINASTGRMNYFGPAADEAKSLLKKVTCGSIVVSTSVADEIRRSKGQIIQDVSITPCENSGLYQILPASIRGREQDMEVNYMPGEPFETKGGTTSNSNCRPKWLIRNEELSMRGAIGKGSVGDYSKALLEDKEVAVKLLVNQKLQEEDLIKLVSDAAILSTTSNPNLLTFRGICVDPSHISIIMDYMPKGDLRKILSDDMVPIPPRRILQVAKDIALGMQFIASLPDEDMRLHESLKSNNIMIGKDWEVKINDYGQRGVKDLARTMTSISSVAWTAPEILMGDPISEKSPVYSYAIILWELVTRKIPYQSEHPLRVVSKIITGFRPYVPPDCPVGLKMLMERCWHKDPDARPSWATIIDELDQL